MYIRSTGVIFQRHVTKEQNGFIYKTNQSWTYALSPTPESILTCTCIDKGDGRYKINFIGSISEAICSR